MRLAILLFLSLMPWPALTGKVPAFTSEGYRIPHPGAELNFPRDHGSHPEYKIEWWYLTGHLYSESGRRFGYQATFFRRALEPGVANSTDPFGNSQLYLAHMALTDPASGSFFFEERLNRNGWDAGAGIKSLDVRNGNWSLVAKNTDTSEILLEASIRSEASIRLTMQPLKPLVRFGPDGTSRKGPDPQARSFYLSFTRMKTEGVLMIGKNQYFITGLSWMDHEIASNQLDENLTGWDWIAIQLNDGWEVKAYLLRKEDGSPSVFSALIWIGPGGKLFYMDPAEFTWEKRMTWKSPSSEAAYPNTPAIRTSHPLTGKEVVFHYKPILMNQELNLPGTVYWEGAGTVLDQNNEPVGSAYLELVGYAEPISGLR